FFSGTEGGLSNTSINKISRASKQTDFVTDVEDIDDEHVDEVVDDVSGKPATVDVVVDEKRS
ncbi:unnamed protein product, partial [Rotaria sp. Silwood2]